MKVRDMMTMSVVEISPDDSCLRAARLMKEHGVGVLVATREGRVLAGVISDRDLVVRCMSLGGDPATILVQACMDRNPATVDADLELELAVDIMRQARPRRLPVTLGEEQVIGILSLDDVARRQALPRRVSRGGGPVQPAGRLRHIASNRAAASGWHLEAFGRKILAGASSMHSSRHIYQPSSLLPSAHAASVVALPEGGLLASWFAGSREGAPDAAIWSSRFEAGSWSSPQLVHDSEGAPDGNSILWIDAAGRLRLWWVTMEGRGWATCVVRERRSSDGGRTWVRPEYVRKEWGWMVRNEPVVWQGRIVLPMYDERDWSSFALVSEDGGETWRESSRLRADAGVIQPALGPLRDGRLLMLLRSRGGSVYRSFSLDATAERWTSPEPTSLPNPNSAVELIRLSTGALLAVYNPTEHGRSPLRVALSEDGERWEPWRDLETEPGEFSYPTAAQTPDGLTHVLYTHRRRTIAHACFDEAWVKGG